jgi:predicted tellurium resistance membrane protein TerC
VVESLTAILSIIIIDLVLSGDNAVVIGMAARSLSPENRRRAIIFGGAGAIGLRILFTALATVLLGIPYLQAIGGVFGLKEADTATSKKPVPCARRSRRSSWPTS